jgi:hypothetical protein
VADCWRKIWRIGRENVADWQENMADLHGKCGGLAGKNMADLQGKCGGLAGKIWRTGKEKWQINREILTLAG